MMEGDRRVHTRVEYDVEGAVHDIEDTDDSFAFESMWCQNCEETLIENGEIVSDAVNGEVV
jgi:hypothetical protein